MATIVKELPTSQTGASQVVIKHGGKFYVVSSVNAMLTGPETLVFRSNKKGDIKNWAEVAGGRRITRKQAIKELEEGKP